MQVSESKHGIDGLSGEDPHMSGVLRKPRVAGRPGVVIVENDPNEQSRIARALRVRGFRVVGASGGDAAVSLLQHWTACVALVSSNLPEAGYLETKTLLLSKVASIAVMPICDASTIILPNEIVATREMDGDELADAVRQSLATLGALATLETESEEHLAQPTLRQRHRFL